MLDRFVLVVFILLAVALYMSTASYTGIAKTTSARYVRFLAMSFGGLSLVQFFLSLRAKDMAPLDLFGRAGRFFGLMAAMIVFAVLFDTFGFFILAAVFIPSVALMLGYRNLPIIAISTVAVLAAVYLIFVTILSVNLPGPAFF